jgi:hypothetical protein
LAVGDRTEKRLVGPVKLTATANSTLGSAVASGRAWVVKQIVFCNTDGTDRLLYFAVNTTATVDNRIFWALPIAANDTIIWDTALVLNATDQFYGYSDTTDKVTFTAVGWEKEV